MYFIDLFYFLLSMALLWFGAEWIVESAAAIARRFQVSELVIGLTVVAFGTSAPEFLVTISAAFKALPEISLSNVVGSNFINLGLILGLVAMIRPVRTGPTLLYRDGFALLGLTGMVLAFAAMGSMGRVTGVVLVGSLVGYTGYLISRRAVSVDDLETPEQREAKPMDYIRLLAGFVAVAFGGSLMVDTASDLALALGVSEWFIGMTMVAFGTSLPELVTCLAASYHGRSSMLLGNLIGSNFFNFAGVLGLTCLIRPLEVAPAALPSLYANFIFVAAVLACIRTGWRVSRKEGALLVGLNILQFALNGH